MALKLITEDIDWRDLEVLSEGENSDRTFKIRGPMVQANIKNGNGRIYPKHICDREVARFIKEEVNRKSALGEYCHPESAIINRERAAVLIEELVPDGNNYIGTAKVLKEFPMGRLVFSMLKEGIPVGMSTRGLGKVDSFTNQVEDSWRLITIDSVDKPSAPDCWVQGIYESKDFIIKDNLIIECAVTELKRSLDRKGSKVIVEALTDFIKSIRKA